MYNITLLADPYLIMKYFNVRPSKRAWVGFGGIMIIGTLAYLLITGDNTTESSFMFGFLFVTLTNAIIGSVFITILALRGTKIFKIWLFFGISDFLL